MKLIVPFILLFAIPSYAWASDTNSEAFRATLDKHLNAVVNSDLPALKSTLSPEGKMQLILPGMEIIATANGFIEYHEEWFKSSNWTFETEVLNTEIGPKYGFAVVEVVYREPDRDGLPYFNRMIVSYDLEQLDGNWYVVKDHASSVEKSTD
jgi:hypothetical protein